MTNIENAIMLELEPLYAKAEKEKLWFYAANHDMLFSPKELRAVQREGRYLWGAVNWQLIDPNEKLNNLKRLKNNIDKQIKEFEDRMRRG